MSCKQTAVKLTFTNRYGIDAILVVASKNGGLYTTESAAIARSSSIFETNSKYFGKTNPDDGYTTAYFRTDASCDPYSTGTVITLYAAADCALDGYAWVVPTTVLETDGGLPITTLDDVITSTPPGTSRVQFSINANGGVEYVVDYQYGINVAVDASFTPGGATGPSSSAITYKAAAGGTEYQYVNIEPPLELQQYVVDGGSKAYTNYSTGSKTINVMLGDGYNPRFAVPNDIVTSFPNVNQMLIVRGKPIPEIGFRPDIIPLHQYYSRLVSDVLYRRPNFFTMMKWLRGGSPSVAALSWKYDDYACKSSTTCGFGEAGQPYFGVVGVGVPCFQTQAQLETFQLIGSPISNPKLVEAYSFGAAAMYNYNAENAPGFAPETASGGDVWWATADSRGATPTGVRKAGVVSGVGSTLAFEFYNIQWLNPDITADTSATKDFKVVTTMTSDSGCSKTICKCGSSYKCKDEWSCWYNECRNKCNDYYVDNPCYTVAGFIFSVLFLILVIWVILLALKFLWYLVTGGHKHTHATYVSRAPTVATITMMPPAREPFSSGDSVVTGIPIKSE